MVVYLLIDQRDVPLPFPVVAAEFVKDFSYILYLQLAMIGFLLFLLFLLFLFFYHPPSPGTLFSLVCPIAVSFDRVRGGWSDFLVTSCEAGGATGS